MTSAGWRFVPKRNRVYDDILHKYVSCQQCIGCRLERSRQWAVRSVHEAQFHDENYFLTLTFSDEFLPKNYSLETKTIQTFWRNFRKAHPLMRFKYYAAGEYGEKYSRPHYHASVFGLELPDLTPSFKSETGFQMYSSSRLDRAWKNGAVYIAPLTFETAAYTARYICKKILGRDAEKHYADLGLMPERAWISKGLGKEWYRTYSDETYRDNYIVARGVPSVPPRTYNRWLKTDDPALHEKYSNATAKSHAEQLKIIDDISNDRHHVARAVKEACLRASKLDFQR